MSQNSFDEAVLSRFEDSGSAHQDNGITINSLTAGDFKDYHSAKRGLSASHDNFIGIIEMKPVGELKPRPTTVSDADAGTSDHPSRYPLPMEALAQTGESPLEQLNQRIINNAVTKVQESMTPAELKDLTKDTFKYAQQLHVYEEEMQLASIKHFHHRPDGWPQAPEKPKSLVKYEEAIDREIERTARTLAA